MNASNTYYGRVLNSEELGRIVRSHRKGQRLTLSNVSHLSKLSTRFLSEFERGKRTSEIGKILETLHILGLEVVIRPRHE